MLFAIGWGYGQLPATAAWANRVEQYAREVPGQAQRSAEERLLERHSANYGAIVAVRSALRPGDVLLLPPAAYVADAFHPRYTMWAEPKVYDYFDRGRPTVQIEDARWQDATVAAVVRRPGEKLGVTDEIAVVRLDEPARRDSVAALFSAYVPTR